MKTVGKFTIDETGTVTGPAAYMRERGSARLRRIERGDDIVIRFGLEQPGADIETLILVSLQTDYAAYRGEVEMFGRALR